MTGAPNPTDPQSHLVATVLTPREREGERETAMRLLGKALDLVATIDAARADGLARIRELETEVGRLREALRVSDAKSAEVAASWRLDMAQVVEAHRVQVETLLASRSWRVTRPLRTVWSLIKGRGASPW